MFFADRFKKQVRDHVPGVPDIPDADDLHQAVGSARGLGNRMIGWRPSFSMMRGFGGGGIISFMFFSAIGRILLIVGIAWLGWSWLTGELTVKERLAWEAAVGQKQALIQRRKAEVNMGTAQAQRAARGRMTRADAIYKLVAKGIFQVEPPDPVEAETVDLINETRGKSKNGTPGS